MIMISEKYRGPLEFRSVVVAAKQKTPHPKVSHGYLIWEGFLKISRAYVEGSRILEILVSVGAVGFTQVFTRAGPNPKQTRQIRGTHPEDKSKPLQMRIQHMKLGTEIASKLCHALGAARGWRGGLHAQRGGCEDLRPVNSVGLGHQ